MSNRIIPPFPPDLREAVAEVSRSVEPLLDDLVARTAQTNEGRVSLALWEVKRSHGRARREALRELDRVVTERFPPVEGAPLPSEELNGKADVLEGSFIGYHHDYANNSFGIGIFNSGASLAGASAVHYCSGPAEPSGLYGPFPMSNQCNAKRK
mgnify:CR=1 FL=1